MMRKMARSIAMPLSPSESPTVQVSFVIVGHPASDRVTRFQAALAEAGQAAARVVGYDELIAGQVALPEVVQHGAVVRIDSPDRDFAVERAILALGAEIEDAEGGFARASWEAVAGMADEAGAIRFPRQWYLGYSEVLRRIGRQLAECPPHRLMNHPDEIAVMFDKRACHALLAEHGVAVPRALGPVRSHEELQARMREAGFSRPKVSGLSHSTAVR